MLNSQERTIILLLKRAAPKAANGPLLTRVLTVNYLLLRWLSILLLLFSNLINQPFSHFELHKILPLRHQCIIRGLFYAIRNLSVFWVSLDPHAKSPSRILAGDCWELRSICHQVAEAEKHRTRLLKEGIPSRSAPHSPPHTPGRK